MIVAVPTGVWILIGIGVVLVLLCVLYCCCKRCCRKKKKKQDKKNLKNAIDLQAIKDIAQSFNQEVADKTILKSISILAVKNLSLNKN